MKVGWQAHCHDPEDQGLQWPYLPPYFPLLTHLFIEEVGIQRHTGDAEHKSHNCLHQIGYRVLEMPPLQLVPMLQKMTKEEEEEEEEAFWCGLDIETGEELELGPLPPNI